INSKRIVLTRWVQEHEEEAHNGTLGTAEEETEDEKHTHTFGRDEVGKPASEEHGGTDDVVRKMLTEVLIDNARLALFFAVPCPDMEYQ
ncbi:unnamed protein product, partial [Brassica rapa subsp. narinosa]